MDLRKRLCRRPLTALLWTALTAVMALLLGLGSALSYTAGRLLPMLDGQHTTIALRTDRASEAITTESSVLWTMAQKNFTREDAGLLYQSGAVEGIYFHSLTGAYCEALSPTLALAETHGNFSETWDGANESYDEVILTGTVLQILEQTESPAADLTPLGYGAQEPALHITAEVQVDEILVAHPDYPFEGTELYDGRIRCTFTLYGQAAQDYIQPGEAYLLCGDYDPRVISRSSGGQGLPTLSAISYNLLEAEGLVGYRYSFGFETDSAEHILRGPVAARLEGSLEDFLADPDNALWTEHIQRSSRAQHCLPVLGTDCLESMYLFVSNEATLPAGRSFTREDYESGARVCILSETLAARSGLQVGDTIRLSQFLCEEFYNLSLSDRATDGMLNNPTVGELSGDTVFQAPEEFTIIGLYRQSNQWEERSWSLTPNTIFIPKSAQLPGGFGDYSLQYEKSGTDTEGEPFTYLMSEERGCYGVLFSVLLRNGCIEAFRQYLSNTPLADQFHIVEQGYDGVIRSLSSLVRSANRLLLLVCGGWLLLLSLYVLLWQGSQRRNLGIMRSLGAAPRAARRYLWGSGLLVGAAGTLAGTVWTGLLLNRLNDKLLALLQAEAPQEAGTLSQFVSDCAMPLPLLLLLAVAQLIIFALVLWCHARAMARQAPRKLLGV